ncbi:MAG: MBOAT family O-acyltransferase, partial [Bacteroidota bacterium]
WLRDYLYIPVGGNRVKSKSRLYFNLWLVFLVSGLWHGASWNFVLWGAFHGFFLVLDRIFLLEWLKKQWRPVQVAICFFLVVMGWVLFRVESLEYTGGFYAKLFAFDFVGFEWGSHLALFWTFIIAIFFSFFTMLPGGKALHDLIFKSSEFRISTHSVMMVITLLLFVLSLAAVTASDFNPFIYYRF